jgi:hypothetical protein
MVSFWRFAKDSSVNDVKMPLYIFTGQHLNMAMAFGIIGTSYETEFKTLEPEVNRALIAFMRRLSMQIKRGTKLYPIPDSVAAAKGDGSFTEYLYFHTDADIPGQPWLLTLRDFAEHQKRIYKLPDVGSAGAMAPLWCSWTDWFSDDVTDKVMLANVREGVKLGIRNYIIDDGWFGPGLDNDYSVQLNIGDWEMDTKKIKDMGALVKGMRELGGVPMIWCAPHAVAPHAKCFPERKKYLIVGSDGQQVPLPVLHVSRGPRADGRHLRWVYQAVGLRRRQVRPVQLRAEQPLRKPRAHARCQLDGRGPGADAQADRRQVSGHQARLHR